MKHTLPTNPLIFDVGANKGQSIRSFKKIFSNPKIHAFEPLKEDFEILKQKYQGDQSVVLNNIALGDKKEKKSFNIMYKSLQLHICGLFMILNLLTLIITIP